MASSTLTPTPSSSSTPHSSCHDPLNIDRYLDYEQNYFPSPSLSPELNRSKLITASASSLSNASHPFASTPPSTQQTFNGPSHQYDDYKQQTGLPVGALANTFAVNQADPFSFVRNQQFLGIPSNNALFSLNTTDDYFDFNNSASLNSALSMTSDMDMDFPSPTQDPFFNSLDSASTDCVDPLAIGGQENSSSSQQSVPGNTIRAWPGMHQQQAALAKAQAEAQQKKQQAVAEQASKATLSSSRRSHGSTGRPPSDPIVEERISRLLNQMRHNSVASSNDDNSGSANASGNSSHGTRPRKDEEDMDDDERLLASEEGKKLSSKERRQLRNKVSARAFRSRRKGMVILTRARHWLTFPLEYIGQLEGEIAAKSAEADGLRVKNEELMAENARLSDLTRMLLSSPAFSTFLSDLSGNGVAPASSSPSGSKPQPSTVKVEATPVIRKDVNPHQLANQSIDARQDVAQIGMTLIPETTLDYGALESTSNAWTEGAMDFSLYDAQVFTITELPQGPAVDQPNPSILSGKSTYSATSYATSDESKHEIPVVERMPVPETDEPVPEETEMGRDDIDFDESDPAFALFANCPPRATSMMAPSVDDEPALFGTIELDKAFGRLELVIEDDQSDGVGSGDISPATMITWERLCSALEASSNRVASFLAHQS